MKYSAIFMAIMGLLWTLAQNSLGPIMMVLGVNIATFVIFKGKNQDITAGGIMVLALATMLTLEYFLVPIQNTAFYILLLIISLGIFLTFYYSLKPQNLLSKRVKILSWTGSILFGFSLFILMGIIFNNFILSLIMGVATIIVLATGLLIRRSISKDPVLQNEFNEVFTTGNSERYWFKSGINGFPKPVCWQGWVSLVVLFLSPFVVIIFTRNLEMAMVFILAIIVTIIVVIMLKSNYR